MNVFEFSEPALKNDFELSFQGDSVNSVELSERRLKTFSNVIVGSSGAGDFDGFGWYRFADSEFDTDNRRQIAANSPTLITIDELADKPASRLKGDFTNAVMWVADRLQTNSVSDALLVRLDIRGKSFVQGNSFKVHLEIGGSFGIIQNDRRFFPFSAGEEDLFNIIYPIYQLDTFKVNGGGFHITSENPCEIWDAAILITPLSSGVLT